MPAVTPNAQIAATIPSRRLPCPSGGLLIATVTTSAVVSL
jgi:hypothetical protein